MEMFAVISIVFNLIALPNQNKLDPRRAEKNKFKFSLAITNVKLMHQCSPKQLKYGKD